MEMEEITVEGGRKEEDTGASTPNLEVKTEGCLALGKAEPNPYSQLMHEAPTKGKQSEGKARLYRAACVLLTIICLILLLVVIILGVKLQTGSTACPETQELSSKDARVLTASAPPTCSLEKCQSLYPNTGSQHRSCQQCADGWLTFGRSCFFLSTFRLSWDESQKNCSSQGGSLAVISSLSVQQFLTHEGKMNYWIGLKQNSNHWAWVNNSALQQDQSYWAAGGPTAGNCGILNSRNPPEKNWMTASCQAYTYFICQLQM